MNMQSTPPPDTPQSLLNRLCAHAERVTADDLSVLAQMHGWCESLAGLWREQAAGEPLVGRARSLMHQLEQLILGESGDAAAALGGIQAEVADLKRLTALDRPPQAEAFSGSEARRACAKNAAAAADVAGAAVPARGPAAATTTAEQDLPAGGLAEASSPPSGVHTSAPLFLNAKELDFVKGFVEEASEHIATIEAGLLEVERTPTDRTRINDLFRPFHTIKGAAGFLNLADIAALTHEAETLLDQARKEQRPVTAGVIDLLFDVVDVLKAQLAGIAGYLSEPGEGPVPQPPVSDMIEKLRAVVAYRLNPLTRAPTEPSAQKTGEILTERAAVPPEAVDLALQVQQADPQRRTGQILVDMGVATPRQVAQAIRSQAAGSAPSMPLASNPADQSVRIGTTKLDTLVDMVGELVIAQTLVTASPQVNADAQLAKNVGQVAKILRNLQEVTLAMRMIPIGPTFQKMARLIRDVSRKAGKSVELTMSGEDTELDKNVIQQIGDPLVHMVRNAVDHGIEAPSARRAAGKPETGRVHLGACHQGGNIIIEISDDGRGLDTGRLVAKAVEKGLVQPGAELSEAEAFALVFAPGLSTAKQVTDISGRGVGMDVVKRNIDKLRGKIEIASEKDRGATFRIRLPLTLAIIDGMIVRVADQRFIIPTIALHQALRPAPAQISTVQHRGAMVQVRGQLIPLIQLGQLFGVSGQKEPSEAMVVIASGDGAPVGLVIDELIGQQQVVIKSLGSQFEGLRGVSGAAILGDGRVGLILEITGLTALHARGTADCN